MKALTFEEWLGRHDMYDNGDIREVFESARIGMIPEGEAVRIPSVSEWPEGVEAVYVGYYDKGVLVKRIAYIPRPMPAWTPKVGDFVFINLDLDYVTKGIGIGEVASIEHDRYKIKGMPNTSWFRTALKHFDASKIGRPWEEI